MPNWIISPEKYLTDDEVKQLRKTLSDAATLARSRGSQIAVRDQLIIELALGTGLRVSELSNLKVADLYLKKGQNALHVRNGKGGKDRVVQFSSKLKKLVLEYLEYRRSGSLYLFHSKRGEQLTRFGIGQVFKQWAQRAGLPAHYSIHSLRHTYATNLYKASGYNLRLIQQQLGHSSVSTTSVYSAVVSKDLDDALERLDEEAP